MLLAACSKRSVQACSLLLAAFSLFFLLRSSHYGSVPLPTSRWIDKPSYVPLADTHKANGQWQHLESAQQLWKAMKPILEKHTPSTRRSTAFTRSSGRIDGLLKRDASNSDSDLTLQDVVEVGNIHRDYVQACSNKIPSLVERSKNPTQGVVTIAGGSSFPALLVTLKMLRRTGSKLPLEVFVPKQDEIEPKVCEDVLPKMSARCIILADILGATQLYEYSVAKTQYKIYSILFSSFEDVFFLDVGSFALGEPTSFLNYSPFASQGLVTWPGEGHRTISPVYHLIANQTAVPPDLSQQTDLGQLLVSKSKHSLTLLLAAYYNYHGPTFFYRLLSQNWSLDKEIDTLTPAAATLGFPYYQVKEAALPIGHNKKYSLDLYTYALLQHNPVLDYEKHTIDQNKQVLRSFIHANASLFDPKTILDHRADGDIEFDVTKNWDGKEVPIFKDPAETVVWIPDAERWIWEAVKAVACDFEHNLEQWKGEKMICVRIRNYWTMRFQAEDRKMGVGKVNVKAGKGGKSGKRRRA